MENINRFAASFNRHKPLLAVAAICLASVLSPHTAKAIELVGVGRKIPEKLFTSWIAMYHAEAVNLTYKAAGPDGFKQVLDGSADFGETDQAFSKADLDKLNLLQVPYMLTAVAPVVNIEGVEPGQLHLDGETLAKIYMGKIQKWNDPAIVAMNLTLQSKLPDAPIHVIHLALKRGLSLPFTKYLSAASEEWQQRVGASVSPAWPCGSESDNIMTIADDVLKTRNSIAYSEIATVRAKNLAYVSLKNRDGNFIEPTMGTVEGATQHISWKPENGYSENLINLPGSGSWPIITASYILFRKHDEREKHQHLVRFLKWSVKYGSIVGISSDFLPVPISAFSYDSFWRGN